MLLIDEFFMRWQSHFSVGCIKSEQNQYSVQKCIYGISHQLLRPAIKRNEE